MRPLFVCDNFLQYKTTHEVQQLILASGMTIVLIVKLRASQS